jgi:hypothetical protein
MHCLKGRNMGGNYCPRLVVTCSSKPVLGRPGTFSAPPLVRVDVGEHRRSVGITLVNNEGLVFAAR